MNKLAKKGGFTLLELMIVAPILVLTATIAFTLLLRGWQAYNFALAQTDASFHAISSLDRISRVLKSTNKLVSITANDVTVEAYFSPRDNVPDHVRYYIQNSTLYVDTTPASGTAPNYTYLPANKKTYQITQLLNGVSNPLFRFYDESGNLLTSPPDINSVHELEVLIITNPAKRHLRVDQRSTTRIQFRNLKTNL